jgi:hypothetical protein
MCQVGNFFAEVYSGARVLFQQRFTSLKLWEKFPMVVTRLVTFHIS